VAADWKATYLPSALIEGATKLSAFAGEPSVAIVMS
jgi:hypothetical protein